MHDAIVDVTGTIENVADGYSAVTKKIDRAIKGPSSGSTSTITNTLELDDDLYFYKGRDMIFTLILKNISTTGYLATITITNTNSKVSLVTSDDYDTFPAKKALATGSSGNTLKFALRLSDESTNMSLSDFSISISLEEWTKKIDSEGNVIEVKTWGVTDPMMIYTNTSMSVTSKEDSSSKIYSTSQKCYAYRFGYYITMGKSSSTATTDDIKWLIVGYMDNNVLKALDTTDTTAFKAGYMPLNKDYCLLSAEVLNVDSASSTNYGISYQNKYNYAGSIAVNDYLVFANDYLTSNVRSYLKDNLVYRSCNYNLTDYSANPESLITTTFEAKYSLDTSSIYGVIKGRKMSDLYADIITETAGKIYETTKVPTNTKITEDGDTEDKFWLLSCTEAETLFLQDRVDSTYYCASAVTTVLGVTSNALGYSTTRGGWWLRSNFGNSNSSYYVDADGNIKQSEACYASSYGVRPAVLI